MNETIELTRKEEILRSAAALFTEKGYPATSMRNLASHVGLEVSSIYSHIKSKEALLTELCMDCAGKFLQGMKEIQQEQGGPAVKLDKLITLHIDIAYEYPASVTVFNKEWRHLPQPALETFVAYRKQYEDAFKEILQQGKQVGVFSFEDTDMMFRIVLQTVKFSYFSVRKFSKNQLAAEVRKYVMSGLSWN